MAVPRKFVQLYPAIPVMESPTVKSEIEKDDGRVVPGDLDPCFSSSLHGYVSKII